MYQGKSVLIVPTAEVTADFQPGRKYGGLVQRILDGVPPWESGDDPIETGHNVGTDLFTVISPNNGRRPVWGVHAGHKARRPQLSPFVHGSGEIEVTRSLTIELAGTVDFPRITRVYPGTYMPPLPWQASAGDADGGKEFCREFWHEYSYIYDRSLILKGTQTNTVPEWYK
jgi:hypothetical protein